jgi:hypothetical protein
MDSSIDLNTTSSEMTETMSPPPICSTKEVVLNVGGQWFTTTIGTLVDRSGFFAALFSGRWPLPEQADGSIFVDADPGVFSHLLCYLRRGIFPLSFDEKSGGHDMKLYIDLLPEAGYFQTPLLEKWLKDELYLKCVEHTTFWKRLSDTGLGTEMWASCPGAQLVKRRTSVTHTWVCPNSLKEDSHRLVYGHGLCREPTEGVVNRQEREEWMEYGKKVTYHRGWCSDEG